MKAKTFILTFLLIVFTSSVEPVNGQIINFADAPVLAKLSEMLKLHRQQLVEAIRTTRGIQNSFQTLQNLDDYERSLRRDIDFMSSLDVSRLDDLEQLILYGDQSDFYFRTLTGKINAEMYNLEQTGRYADGFLGAMDGLGVVDANLIRGIYSSDKTLEEVGITPTDAQLLIDQLGDESTLLKMHQVQGIQNLIRALTAQAESLKRVAQDSSIKMDQGQRVLLLTKSEESYIEAMKYQQELAKQLDSQNEEITRNLFLKGQMESEIKQLESFYEWRASLENNLGFFDTDYIKRERYK